MAATAKKGTVIRKALADNQLDFAEILDYREIASSGNIVLMFANSEVVMPGNWRLRRELVVGDVVKAYWDEEHRFHLVWKDAVTA